MNREQYFNLFLMNRASLKDDSFIVMVDFGIGSELKGPS